MGGCFSSWIINPDNDEKIYTSAANVNVITINGEFRQFPPLVTVCQVLLQLQSPSSSSFICNSDNLYYDEIIPALDSEHELQSCQIYFILSITKLNYPLSASDMAALAVKASAALSTGNNGSRRRGNCNKKARISPVLAIEVNNERVSVNKSYSDGTVQKMMKKKGYSDKMAGTRISRSGSMKKLQRYSSRRAELAARSFRLRLKTIYEGSVLQF